MMSLRDWFKNGWIVEHKSSIQEIAGFLNTSDRDLANCQVSGLDSDWKFNIAYNAALHAATAALAAEGYRAAREAHHYRTIQSLAYSIGLDSKSITQLDYFRKKRNLGTYEIAGSVSDQEAVEMLLLATRLRREVESWIRKTHPEFFELKS
jgi:hypothetical protein